MSGEHDNILNREENDINSQVEKPNIKIEIDTSKEENNINSQVEKKKVELKIDTSIEAENTEENDINSQVERKDVELKINTSSENNKNTQMKLNKFKDIIETVEVIQLIYKGDTEKIERPINNIGKYGIYIKVINDCITQGTSILNDMKKITKGNFEFETWAELSSKIISIIKKTYRKYEDIKEWNSQKRLELAIIVTYEIIFNHYYVLYSNNGLTDKDNQVLHYLFSEEGKIALKCICNATVTLFNEIDENDDGEISCSEIKACCCTPSKWCTVFKACLPKKKPKN